MSWYALDAFDDAVDATKGFLFPFERSRWWRLVVIVLFLGGGGGGGGNALSNVPSSLPDPGAAPTVPAYDAILLILLVTLLALVLAFALLSQTMRFVFIDALHTDEVRLKRVVPRLTDGLRVLLFTVAVWVILLAVVGLVTYLLFLGPQLAGDIGAVGVVLLVLTAFAVLAGLVVFFHFTYELVVPTMVALDCGVLHAWRQFWGRLRAQPWQFLLYLVVRAFVNLGVGIVVGLLLVILGGLVLLVAAVVGGVVVLAFGGLEATFQSIAGIALIALIALVAILVVVFLVALPLQVVGRTFTTTYALSVLGRAEPAWALLPDYGDDADEDGDAGSDADEAANDDDADTAAGDDGTELAVGDDGNGADDRDDVDTELAVDDDGNGADDRDDVDDDAGGFEFGDDDR